MTEPDRLWLYRDTQSNARFFFYGSYLSARKRAIEAYPSVSGIDIDSSRFVLISVANNAGAEIADGVVLGKWIFPPHSLPQKRLATDLQKSGSRWLIISISSSVVAFGALVAIAFFSIFRPDPLLLNGAIATNFAASVVTLASSQKTSRLLSLSEDTQGDQR